MNPSSAGVGGHHFYRPQLDVVRFLAFVAVFLHHVLPRNCPLPTVFLSAANAAGFGLSLFFVLSAYLLTLLLLRERDLTGRVHLGSFYLRRMLRIWPLYLLGLSIGVGRAYSHGVLQEQRSWFIAALFMAGNFVYPGAILMSHLWSISVEEQFYLIFPFICKTGGRRGLLILACILTLNANIALIYFSHIHADLDVRVWFSSLVQFEMFAAGISLALIDHRLKKWSALVSCGAIASSLLSWLLVARFTHLKSAGMVAQSSPLVCLGYGVVAVSCCLLIVAMQNLRAPNCLVYSGRISYGLYVFHLPVLAFLGSRIQSRSACAFISFGLTYGISAFSYRFFEAPFLELKQRFEWIPTRGRFDATHAHASHESGSRNW